MKSMKKEFIILGVIIVVLLAYLFFRSSDKVHYTIPELEEIKAETIDKIEIKRTDMTITLEKKDDKWLIQPQGYPVSENRITRLVDTIGKLTLTDLASRSKNYTLYDLHDEKVIHVKAFEKDEAIRQFDVGKTASTYGHTFVRLDGDSNVYYARESFRSFFEAKVDNLRDKVVMKVDANEISEITIEKADKAFLFSKNVKPAAAPTPPETKEGEETPAAPQAAAEEITWLTPDGKKGKKTALDSLINQFGELSCQEYIEDKSKEDLEKQAPLYTLKLKGSKDYVIKIFPKPGKKEGDEESATGTNYPAISSESPYPFVLASWKGDQIMKSPEDLLEEVKKEEKK
jgi:hypothetical protein